MKIEDNYLDQEKFDELQTIIMGNRIDWHYNDGIDYKENDKFQFTHLFYHVRGPHSILFEKLEIILEIINPILLWRIKANLLTRTPEIEVNIFHKDIPSNWGVIPYTTSIFYMNTNNGYTEFEDGTKVESVANRCVTFPEETKHRGTSCTDKKTRVVINFNYLT